MKKIALVQLSVTNYRNIPYATLQFEGDSQIVGENKIGKTNTLEAIVYLLTNKLLNGQADLSAIKPLDDTSKEVIVKGTFDIDGETISLKKSYKERWVKKRGTTEVIMEGHDTTCYINDIKQAKIKDYNDAVNEAFGLNDISIKSPIEIMRLLVDPFYLADMGESPAWSTLRSFIIELVGDVKDEDVFAENETLLPIKADLENARGKFELAKKNVAQQINAIKTQIIGDQAIVNKFSEITKPTDEEIALANKGIEEHETVIAKLRANNGEDELSKSIEKQIVEVERLVNEATQKKLAYPNPKKQRYDELDSKIREQYDSQNKVIEDKGSLNSKLWLEDSKVTKIEKDIAQGNEYRAELVMKIRELDAKKEKAAMEVQTECPYCHVPYDQSKIDEMVKENIRVLNEKRFKLVEQGKANKAESIALNAELEGHKSNVEKYKSDILALNAKVDEINLSINKLKTERDVIDLDNFDTPYDEEIVKLNGKKLDLQDELNNARITFAQGCQDVNLKIIEEQNAMQPFKNVLTEVEHYNRSMLDKKEAEELLDKHNRDLGDLEQKMDLFITFNRIKLEMLDNNVAKVFGNIKFQLISENINGGYDAVCKPYIYDIEHDTSTNVTWKSGSKSERVVTGIAIAEAIKKELELPNLPFLFDEGGEISTDTFARKFKTRSQLICVKVVDGIPTPTVLPIERN